MLTTPKKHLPPSYPLPTKSDHALYEPIFTRAFEIHKTAHDFSSPKIGPRDGIISPVKGRTNLSRARYCDCYERAYQELHKKVLGR